MRGIVIYSLAALGVMLVSSQATARALRPLTKLACDTNAVFAGDPPNATPIMCTPPKGAQLGQNCFCWAAYFGSWSILGGKVRRVSVFTPFRGTPFFNLTLR